MHRDRADLAICGSTHIRAPYACRERSVFPSLRQDAERLKGSVFTFLFGFFLHARLLSFSRLRYGSYRIFSAARHVPPPLQCSISVLFLPAPAISGLAPRMQPGAKTDTSPHRDTCFSYRKLPEPAISRFPRLCAFPFRFLPHTG